MEEKHNNSLGPTFAFVLAGDKTMMLQLNPSIPVETPKGKGQATILIDYSPEHDFYWVVFLDESRECWTFPNKDIRAQANFTIGRGSFTQTKTSFPPVSGKLISETILNSPA